MFAADLTKLTRNDRRRTQLRQVRGQVLACYLSRVAAVWTRQQEPRTLVVVILHRNNSSTPRRGCSYSLVPLCSVTAVRLSHYRRSTDARALQTTDRQTTDGRAIAYSKREREFMFTKNPHSRVYRPLYTTFCPSPLLSHARGRQQCNSNSYSNRNGRSEEITSRA